MATKRVAPLTSRETLRQVSLSRRTVLAGMAATASASTLLAPRSAAASFRLPAKQAPVELRLLARGDSWDPDNAYLPIIEGAVNVDLSFDMTPSEDYVAKRNVVMASGDYPDAIRVSPREPVYRQYIDDGLLRPLDDLLNRFPAVRDAFPPEVWEINRAADGMIYHIPRITGFFPITIAYRKDWADILGIAAPATTAEFADMLRAFRDENPGQVPDLIPFTPNRSEAEAGLPWLGPLFSPFGADYQAWQPLVDETSLVFSSAQPTFKDALSYVRDLREEDLLDPGFLVTQDRGLFKFYAGQAGATTDWPQFMDLRLEAIREVHPDGEIAYIVGLSGPTGIAGGPLWNPADQDLGSALTIAASDEQADAFFRMIEWQYTDGYELMTLGVEGITFDVVDGEKIRRGRDEVVEENPAYDLYMLDRVFFAEPPRQFEFTRDNPMFAQFPDAMFQYVTDVLQTVEAQKHIDYLLNIDDPAIYENEQPISNAVVETASRLILNPDLDPDDEFVAYLDRLNDLGLVAFAEAVNRLNTPTLPE